MKARQQQGFTLIELMVAVTITSIVIAMAFAVFAAQQRTAVEIENASEVQQDARLIAQAILSDIRMAGYMLPKTAGIASVDGGNSATDLLCVSDPSKIDDAEAADASSRFEGANTSSALGGNDSSVTLIPADLDIDGDSDEDFVVGEGVIIVDGTNVHCGRITSITGGSNEVIGFAPATPGTFAAAAGGTTVVPAIVYRVNGTDLMRNDLRVASLVDDLQIEFAVDDDSDGLIVDSEYENDLDGEDPDDLLAVRLSVISRADRAEEALDTDAAGRPAAANRAAGAADGFRRRRITATVIPRNLL